MNRNYAIEANNISKSYTDVKAIEEISFHVNQGELFGLIGPDGSGKTTLIRVLTTLLLADKGTATVEGLDVVKEYKKIRHIIGYMPGKFSLYQDLSVEENLSFYATVFGTTIQENYHLIKDIYSQIEPFKKRLAGKLSGGMKQKLALSCALIHKPKVLFLDEPTTGVDAVSRKEFWEMLKNLNKEGITILVSTPYMDEAGLCDRVALMQSGKIMSISTPKLIVTNFGETLIAIRSNSIYHLLTDLRNYSDANSVLPFGQYVHYTAYSKKPDLSAIETYLIEKGHQQIELKIIEPDIEDCFMKLMRKEVVSR